MKNLKKVGTMLLLILFVVVLLPNNVQAKSKVKLNKTGITIIKGQSYNLELKNNTKKIKWTSSDKKIATVNSKAKVKALNVGTTTVTAQVGNDEYTCTVKVEKPSLSVTKATINVGNNTTLQMNNTTLKVKWSTSNKSIATVNSKGKIVGKKAGNCKIYAKVGGKTYTCKVTVKVSDLDNFNYDEIILTKGNTFTQMFNYNNNPSVWSGEKWSSSNKNVATVNSKGKIKGIGVGKTTITAKYKNKNYKFDMYVIDKKILYEDEYVKVSLNSLYSLPQNKYWGSGASDNINLTIQNKTDKSFTFVTEGLGANGEIIFNGWESTKIPAQTSSYHNITFTNLTNLYSIKTLSGSMYIYGSDGYTIENIDFSNIKIIE